MKPQGNRNRKCPPLSSEPPRWLESHKVAGGEDVQANLIKDLSDNLRRNLDPGIGGPSFRRRRDKPILQREQYQQGGVGQERVLLRSPRTRTTKNCRLSGNALSLNGRQEISNDVATKVNPEGPGKSSGSRGASPEQLGGTLDSNESVFRASSCAGTDPAKVRGHS